MKMLLLPKAPLDLHVAANLSENWRILNNFSQADFKFSHEPSLASADDGDLDYSGTHV